MTGYGACSETSRCLRTGWPWCLEADKGAECRHEQSRQAPAMWYTNISCFLQVSWAYYIGYLKKKEKVILEASRRLHKNATSTFPPAASLPAGWHWPSSSPPLSPRFLICTVELILLTHGTVRRVMRISHLKCPSQDPADRCELSLSSMEIKGVGEPFLGRKGTWESGYENGWILIYIFILFLSLKFSHYHHELLV